MKVKWFGEPWPSATIRAPVCQHDEDRVDTPIWQACIYCEKQFQEGDRGIVMGSDEKVKHAFQMITGFDKKRKKAVVSWVAAGHIDCHLDAVIGPATT